MLDVKKTVLLITGCVKPKANVFNLQLKDVNLRFQQYIECIKWSVEHTKFENITFVDNSGYPIDTELIEFANKQGKKLEWLSFIGNEKMIASCGKGYGEGEIIEYALEHSKQLNKATYFCKLTGRLKVDNMDRFIKLADMNGTYFWTMGLNKIRKFSDGVETRFYGMPIKIYKATFVDAYKAVDDKNGMWLEKTFYKEYNTKNVKCKRIALYPDFSGQSGSMGIDYKVSRRVLVGKTLASALGFYCPRKI